MITIPRAIVITHLEKLREKVRTDGSIHPKIAYIYMHYGQTRTLEEYLGAITRQLVESEASFPESLKSLWENRQRKGRRTPPTMGEISSLLCKLAAQDRPLIVVIDALDECSKDVRERLLDHLGDYKQIRMFVASRPLDSIGAWTDDFRQVAVKAHTEDIHRYIDYAIDMSCDLKGFVKKDPSLRTEIKATITHKSNGM
jgi:hypothetical protein